MQAGSALLIAAVVVLVLLIAAAFVWYHYTGWKSFSFQQGQSVSWQAPSGNIKNLRFKNTVFSVALADGSHTYTQDVTTVLNGMAVAYKNAAGSQVTDALNLQPTATLGGVTVGAPLNAFSFVLTSDGKPGSPVVNNQAAVPNPSVPAWANARVTLVGFFRDLGPSP